MDNNNTNSPVPCTAGCGFFGNESFNNMCSKCYKAKTPEDTAIVDKLPTIDKLPSIDKLPIKDKLPMDKLPTIDNLPSIDKSRKHVRSPSPDNPRSAPAPVVPTTDITPEKPVQTNKGRCFNCRIKVPLAKQAANKCRCGYVFCDSHRYPDRHDCDVDFAKRDREILAKNNPKLHERPRGGRSFQRIDSL